MGVDVDSDDKSVDLTELPASNFEDITEEEDEDFISVLQDIDMLNKEHLEVSQKVRE